MRLHGRVGLIQVLGVAMQESNSRAEVDALVGRFFGAFDNRGKCQPSLADLVSYFSPQAIVAKHFEGQCALYSPEEFAAPRVALLAGGELIEFHEWEESNTTEVLGSLAIRASRYAKSGTYNGQPYGGTGTKFFQLAKFRSGWQIVALSWIDDA